MDNLRVVLVAVRNPLNIGAAARAMHNFGARHLRLVKPYDVAFREAKSAVGAAPVLAAAEEFDGVAEAVADCSLVVGTTSAGHRELQHPLRRLEIGAGMIRRRMPTDSVALLFGSEKFGLSNEDMSHCHWLMRIGMAEPGQSMNLGQAVAVCLYELGRGGGGKVKAEGGRRATASQDEQVTELLLEALRLSGYIKAPGGESAAVKVRRLVRRLEISGHDAPVLLGMLRQILWKLGQS